MVLGTARRAAAVRAAVLTVAVTTLVSFAEPAAAKPDDSANDTAAAVSAAVGPADPDTPVPVAPVREGSSLVARAGGVAVAAPVSPTGTIQIRTDPTQPGPEVPPGDPPTGEVPGPPTEPLPPGDDGAADIMEASPDDFVTLGLPRLSGLGDARVSTDGTVVYPGGSADVAVQALEDGSTRTFVTVKNAAAPTTYRFPVTLPAGSVLRLGNDGNVFVVEKVVGGPARTWATIAAPWAVDANGVEVPTSYTVEGNTLVQHLDHAGAAYPVVADPWVSLCWWYGVRVCVKFSRNETAWLARAYSYGVSEAVSAFCSLIAFTVLPAAVCAGVVAAYFTLLRDLFNRAKSQRRCVRIRYTLNGWPVNWGVVRC